MSSLTTTAQLVVTDRSGVERTIEGEDGLSVMEIIRNAGAAVPFDHLADTSRPLKDLAVQAAIL